MHCQPDRTVRDTPNNVARVGGQEQVVAGMKLDSFTRNLESRLALKEHNPLIVVLYVLHWSRGRRTDDALNNEVPVSENRLEALPRQRGFCVSVQVSNMHDCEGLRHDA